MAKKARIPSECGFFCAQKLQEKRGFCADARGDFVASLPFARVKPAFVARVYSVVQNAACVFLRLAGFFLLDDSCEGFVPQLDARN